MGISIKVVEQALSEITADLDNNEFLLNPFFRIPKPTPECMKKYAFLNYKFSRIRSLFKVFFFIPISLTHILLSFTCSVIFSYQYKEYKTSRDDFQVLILSHAIGQNISPEKSDQFFGFIPNYVSRQSKNVLMLYTNHFIFRYKKNKNKLNMKNDEITRLILPKFLKPNEHLKYFNTCFNQSKKCLYLGLKKMFDDPLKSNLLLEASFLYFSRPTYSNYLMTTRIKMIVATQPLDSLFMTFEGHSYEQHIMNQSLRIRNGLRIILYQHSPITIDQFGIRRFLESNTNAITILVTGRIYQNLFQSMSGTPNYIVFGTYKASLETSRTTSVKSNMTLFSPDGSQSVTREFITLIKYLCVKAPNEIFCLRLHPNLKRNLLILFQLKILSRKNNFILSTLSLHDDLIRSKFLVYRSSAVGIEALKTGTTPLFYGKKGQQDMNPLAITTALYSWCSDAEEILSKILANDVISQPAQQQKIFKNMFSEIDYEKIENIFSQN